MITMRQLEALSAVIEHQTVTEAARFMNLSQPALSKLISNLEYRTGLPLFRRVKRRLVPTEEALILHEKAGALFTGLGELDRLALDLRNLTVGRLQIVSLAALGRQMVPQALASHLDRRGDIEVGLHLHSSHTVNAWAINQQADLGLTMIPLAHPAVETTRLCRVPAVCVLPVGHRLQRRRRIEARDLDGEAFVSFTAEAAIRREMDAVFDRLGVQRQLRLETYTSESACALVSAGLGVALADPFTAHGLASHGELVMKPFEPAIEYEFFLLRPRHRSPSRMVDAFAAHLHQELDRHRSAMPL